MNNAESLWSPRSLHESASRQLQPKTLPASTSTAITAPVPFVLFDRNGVFDNGINRLFNSCPRTLGASLLAVFLLRAVDGLVGDHSLLVGIPSGNSAGNLVFFADVIQLAHTMTTAAIEAADVRGIRAHDALNQVFCVSCFVASTAEMARTSKASEVGEVFLRAIVKRLNAVHVIETTACFHETFEDDVGIMN